jgi:GNAT superfamily N-acetyltransferase
VSSGEYEFSHHGSGAAAELLDELCVVYADAYGVGPGEKVDGFRGRAERAFAAPRFDLVTAYAGTMLAGFVFGYSLESDAWWSGLRPEPAAGFTAEDGTRTAVLSEIEVRAELQRRGLGRRLAQEFLTGRVEERATLATGRDVPSRHVYPRWGWTEVGVVPGPPGSYFSSYRLFILPLGTSRPEELP